MSVEEVAGHANRMAAAVRAAARDLDPEIAAIVNANPDYDSGVSNGYAFAFDSLPDGETTEPVGAPDPIECFANAERSCIERYADHWNYYVGNTSAWKSGWNPAAFAVHVKRTSKARRYGGIEAETLDAKGRVKSLRSIRQS
jgi:hypothetical protein